MWLVKFVFIMMIIIPVAIIMLVIFRKLAGEYSAAVKREHYIKSGKHRRDKEAAQYAHLNDYRRDNPNYDAYRRRMEENNYNKDREK